MMYDDDNILSISGIQHFVFCRRQWALIHIEQQWAENLLTVSGEIMHEKAHDDTFTETRNGIITSRGMQVSSYELGIYGVCDIVEFVPSDDGAILFGKEGKYSVVPVEYKHGESPSARRVWIEMEVCKEYGKDEVGHLPRGRRGLKSRCFLVCKSPKLSPSARKVWIEIQTKNAKTFMTSCHLPRGSCGLKSD